MDNPFIMFISILLGTIIGRAITDYLFKDKDKDKEEDTLQGIVPPSPQLVSSLATALPCLTYCIRLTLLFCVCKEEV